MCWWRWCHQLLPFTWFNISTQRNCQISFVDGWTSAWSERGWHGKMNKGETKLAVEEEKRQKYTTAGRGTHLLMTRSGAKQSMLPLHCSYDRHPRLKDMRKSQEHCSNVIWSSRCRLRKPKQVKRRKHTTIKTHQITLNSADDGDHSWAFICSLNWGVIITAAYYFKQPGG